MSKQTPQSKHYLTDGELAAMQLAAVEAITGIGDPEYSQARFDRLIAIKDWLAVELKLVDYAAHDGAPWAVLYCSQSNRDGQLVATHPTNEEAVAHRDRANPTASFGWYQVQQQRHPFPDATPSI